MPNDNTHTLLPCPFCGGSAKILKTKRHVFKVHCSNTKCTAHQMGSRTDSFESAAAAWNTRTPAEPKAGDWEKEVEIHTAVEIHDRFQNDGIGDTEYVRLDEVRALSSAAPRITEGGMGEDWWSETLDTYFAEHADGKRKMPPGAYLRRHWEEDTGYWCNELVHIRQGEDWTTADIDTMWIGPFPEWIFNAPAPLSGITGDSDKSDLPIANSVQLSEEMVEGILDGIRVRGNTDRHHGIRTGIEKAKVAMIALLRQQGAERKWISVDERLPETGELVWGILSDFKPGNHPSHVEYERASNTWTFYGDDDWYGIAVTHWCPHIADTPPPFTPTQTEE